MQNTCTKARNRRRTLNTKEAMLYRYFGTNKFIFFPYVAALYFTFQKYLYIAFEYLEVACFPPFTAFDCLVFEHDT